jgi:hypothetical protein
MAINVISFKQQTVKKIATNVSSGAVIKHNKDGRGMTYLATIRATGEAAPSADDIKNEGFIMFQDHAEQEIIANDTAIDIYAYCDDGGALGDTGKLVVWS